MIEKIYNINNKKIFIYCEIEEYCSKIENWMNVYDNFNKNILDNYSYYIKIYKDKLIWNINGKEKKITKKILATDLYPLFYNMIANRVNDKNNILLHSAVLCYNNVGILVVGDFNSGKTTLCLKALNNDFKVLSADQSFLYYIDNKLMLKKGSNYMKINDNDSMYIMEKNCNIEIKVIVNLVGLCENGMAKYNLENNKEHLIKTMFKFCTWHSDIPFVTDNNIILEINRKNIYEWLANLNIPLYHVRGDALEIIKKIKEEII